MLIKEVMSQCLPHEVVSNTVRQWIKAQGHEGIKRTTVNSKEPKETASLASLVNSVRDYYSPFRASSMLMHLEYP